MSRPDRKDVRAGDGAITAMCMRLTFMRWTVVMFSDAFCFQLSQRLHLDDTFRC